MRQKSPDNKVSEDFSETTANHSCRKALVVATILTVVTVVAYWGLGSRDFISFDDNYYVTDNYHVKQGLSSEGTKWAFTAFFASNWHPLTWLSHMLDVQLFGLSAGWHHLANLFFHCLNAILLLWFLFYTTERLWASAFVAAVFALHPLHVESVAWISERKDVLSTCFWLLTMLAYASYVKNPSRSRYALALVLFSFGLMAKPMLVTLPIVLLMLDYWPLARVGMPFRRLLLEKLPFAGLAFISAAVTILAQKLSINTETTMTLPMQVSNALVSYGRYIWMMVWPMNLAIFYPHPHRVLLSGSIAMSGFIILVTLVAIRLRKSHPYILLGWLWYIITLIPVIGFLQVGDQSHADRYTYIPLTGLFIIIAWGAGDIVRRLPSVRPAFEIAAGLLSVALVLLTWQTMSYWKDSITIFTQANSVSPDNGKIESSLGSALVDAGRQKEGVAYLEKATRSPGHDGSAYNALGSVYLSKGESAKAIPYFIEAAKCDWMNIKAEYCLGLIYLEQKQFADAGAHLRKAVALKPFSADAHSLLAIALSETDTIEQARAECDRAAALEPNAPMVKYARGCLLLKAGDFQGAIDAYRKSVAATPTYVGWGGLAFAYFQLGKLEDAAEGYKKALALRPNQPDAHYNLALMFDKLGRAEEAAQEYKRALELNPNDADAQAAYRRLTTPQ